MKYFKFVIKYPLPNIRVALDKQLSSFPYAKFTQQSEYLDTYNKN